MKKQRYSMFFLLWKYFIKYLPNQLRYNQFMSLSLMAFTFRGRTDKYVSFSRYYYLKSLSSSTTAYLTYYSSQYYRKKARVKQPACYKRSGLNSLCNIDRCFRLLVNVEIFLPQKIINNWIHSLIGPKKFILFELKF